MTTKQKDVHEVLGPIPLLFHPAIDRLQERSARMVTLRPLSLPAIIGRGYWTGLNPAVRAELSDLIHALACMEIIRLIPVNWDARRRERRYHINHEVVDIALRLAPLGMHLLDGAGGNAHYMWLPAQN